MQVAESDTEFEDSTESESEEFCKLINSAAQITQVYVDMHLDKNPARTSILFGMSWLLEILRTPGEFHTQLRMNTEIFLDLLDLLVARYGLKPSMHISTHETLAIFLFVCGGNEPNRRTQNRFKHPGETINRKFNEVLNSLMAMAHDFIPKDPNFRALHRRIRGDRRAYPHFKDCIGALDGTHIRVTFTRAAS